LLTFFIKGIIATHKVVIIINIITIISMIAISVMVILLFSILDWFWLIGKALLFLKMWRTKLSGCGIIWRFGLKVFWVSLEV